MVSKAVDGVVIDHACRLHEGIANSAANEAEAAFFQVFRHRVRYLSADGYVLDCFPPIDHGFAICELPDVGIKTAELMLDFNERPGIGNGGFDLEPVADNAWIIQQGLYFAFVIAGNYFYIKISEQLAVVFTLFKDGCPAQAGLRAFQCDELKKFPVIMQRYTPFVVMVVLFKFAAQCPGATM